MTNSSQISRNIKRRLYTQVSAAKKKIEFETGIKLINLNINYKKITNHLISNLPEENIKDFEIDYIIPLSYLNNGNKDQIEQAFFYKNLRWVNIDINREKSNKIDPRLEIEIFDEYRKEKLNNDKEV